MDYLKKVASAACNFAVILAGCSIGLKPYPLHVNKWDLSQLKKIKLAYTSNNVFKVSIKWGVALCLTAMQLSLQGRYSLGRNLMP